MEKEIIFFCRGEGKGGKYLEKENIWSTEENKNEEGTGGKYLEKDNISFGGGEERRRRRRRKIFGEGKVLVGGEEKNIEGKGGKKCRKGNRRNEK